MLVLAVGCATSGDAVKPAAEPEKEDSAPAAQAEDSRALLAARAHAELTPAPPAPPPAEEPKASAEPKRTAADPFGDVGFKEVNQKDWLASLRQKISEQEKVPPTDLRVSPGLLRAAYVRSPPVAVVKPGRRAPPRRHEIVVVDNQGRRLATFRAVAAKHGDEPPKDLRFLSEERVVYEVVEPPPEPAPAGKPVPRKAAHAKKAKVPSKPAPVVPTIAVAPLPPPRTFVIQAVAPRARPLKCVGFHFTFTHDRDKLAFVAGTALGTVVSVDGAQVYPRRGRTVVASAPAWSKDGRSLAFLELPAGKPARLVMLAELDNATGDTTWDLPPTASTDGTSVFWAGSSKLVVGKTQLRPVFSAAFTKESPGR